MDLSERHARLLLLALLALAGLYVFADAARVFHQTDDFWYAEIVSRMIEDGDYLVPRFGPLADFNKPPLFYWLSVPASLWLDDLRVAMRLLPGLSFLALIVCIYRMGAATHSRVAGLLAAAVFASTYDHLHNHGYKSGVPEGLLNLEIAAVLWLNVGLVERPRRLPWIAALCGAAFMTKTAFALVPFLISLPGILGLLRQRRLGPGLALLSGLAGLGVVVPWFAAAIAREGSAVLDQMFLDQVLGRMTNDGVAERTGRIFGRTEIGYPIRHYLVWGAPWSLLLPVAGLGLFGLRERLTPEARRLAGLCGLWLLVIFGALVTSRASWGWYMSSAYVPASLLVGLFLCEFLRGVERRAMAATYAVAAAGFVVLPSLLLYNPYRHSSGTLPLDGWSWIQLGVAAALFAGLAWRLQHGSDDETISQYESWPSAWVFGGLASCAALLAGIAWWLPQLIAGGTLSSSFGALASLAVLVGASHLTRPGARSVAVAALFTCALGYLLAPLVHLGSDNRREDVKWMQAQAAQGAFANGRQLELRTRLYTYIRLYHSFHETYQIDYQPEKQLLRLRERGPS